MPSKAELSTDKRLFPACRCASCCQCLLKPPGSRRLRATFPSCFFFWYLALLGAAVLFASACVARPLASSASFYLAVRVLISASVACDCFLLTLFANSLVSVRAGAVSCAGCSG